MDFPKRPVERLLAIMARLRDPEQGCPWDLEQTYASIVPHTLEEAYEVADTIERGDLEHLKDELGDLLFQVVYYAQLAREEGRFDFGEIAQAAGDKIVARHPHVFGDAEYESDAARATAWEEHKAREREAKLPDDQPASALDGVTHALPALSRAQKLQKRAAGQGFDWPDVQPVLAKIEEELNELRRAFDARDAAGIQDEIGDLLFSAVNLARHADADAETVLRAANRKFEHRFKAVEASLAETGRKPKDCDLAELDTLWERVKREN